MGRRAKPPGGKADVKQPRARKSPKDEDSRVRDLEKRLADALKREGEGQEQQAATSEILRVISSSPTDLQPVFDAIVDNAQRLLRGHDAVLARVVDDHLYLAASNAVTEAAREATRNDFPRPIFGHPSTSSRAVRHRVPVMQEDLLTNPEVSPAGRELARIRGFRSVLSVPLLRDGEAIGAINVSRATAGTFTDGEIALLKTFADQAVIAIENVRLFNETKEALEQQTATSEILRAMAHAQTDAQPVFDTIVRSAAHLCQALAAAVFLTDGRMLYEPANYGSSPEARAATRARYPRPVGMDTTAGMAVLTQSVVHIPDTEDASAVAHVRQSGRIVGFRSCITVPMLRDRESVGAILVARHQPGRFSESDVALLKTFADQAVIAIANVRLFTELQTSNRELTTALDTQTATSDILRVISSSPTDTQPVFDAIAANATRLCDAVNGLVLRFDGQLVHLSAHYNVDPERLEALQRIYPMPPNPGAVSGRVVISRAIVHVPDVNEDLGYTLPAATTVGYRSVLGVPLLRDGVPLGTILIARDRVAPFSDAHIALIQTFADQAVIAIENVRLFTELEARNRDLTTALEQQTATSEILRVISSTPADTQPVFDAIVNSTQRLMAGKSTVLLLRRDPQFVVRAYAGPAIADLPDQVRVAPLDREQNFPSRAILDAEIVHVPDWEADDVPEHERVVGRSFGIRAGLMVPLLREGQGIGALVVTRSTAGPYDENEIALLRSFADQAVIAIENVRLFKELQSSNSELRVALEQQTATSELLKVIGRSTFDLQPVFETLAENAVRLCEGNQAFVFRLDGQVLRVVAAHNVSPELRAFFESNPVAPGRGSVAGRAAFERRTIHIDDVRADPERTWAAHSVDPIRTVLTIPMLRAREVLGVIGVNRLEVRPFSDNQIALLETFADQAAIAIENARLLTELQQRNEALTQAHAQVSEALEQQTATSEILRVISSSPTDAQPVFDTIARSAARLCEAYDVIVFRVEGDVLRLVAHHGAIPASDLPLLRGMLGGRTVIERRVIHVEDLQAERNEFPEGSAKAREYGHRTVLSVPLLRGGVAIGNIQARRDEVRPFTDQQVTLLQTFADQAVIAIENVRLFTELQARTGELTRSVDELRALSEVGQAISSTLDLQTVLSTIVARATQLTGVDAGVIYEYDEQREVFLPRATEQLEAEIVETMLTTPVRKGEGATGRLAEAPEPIQVPDILAAPAESQVRGALVHAGYRALLAVPLVREDHLIGGLTVFRKTPGEFAPDVVELLKTFATQSALAIQNARLFLEIAKKSEQLEVASRHKSEFLASMSHELRTPLNAILGFNEMLLGQIYGEVPADMQPPLAQMQSSGKHLLRLINNVLDLAKIEAGRMELALSDYSVLDTVESVRSALRPLAADKGLEFLASVPADIPLAYGDSGRITQCLMNLAGNSLKFTKSGKVEIQVEAKGDLLVFTVADTGIGIPVDKIGSLFTEFKQTDATIASEYGGTGLGLSISKKFIEMHGGRIWVESEPGKGSEFSFEVPLRVGGRAQA